MAISESQLETWSHLGSVQQSAKTYETIQKALNDGSSPYSAKDFSVFLQGSYGNGTNVYRDSDVDVVIQLNQTYYANTNALDPDAKANYDRAFSPATYTYREFKADVLAWLQEKFGSDVKPGKKAIFIKGNGSRRDADVIVCSQHRRYRAASTGIDSEYDEGIIFWANDGAEIVNFPKQHSESCTRKHQNTNSQFKRMVRICKNMRNRMIDDGYIADGVAPSYFLEGMLWNVPTDQFVQSYEESFVNIFNWVLRADKTQLACANDLYWLVRDNANVCWSTGNFDAYLAAARTYWNDWKN
ncbi:MULTISPECIES: nucleotidyltransferase domain-containing protein [Burkholderia cepacia complex]|uniref:Nucleotidyltransferase n=1 Tax=Burkholderia cenocepacia TaxID=95486 RepID=A0ABD4U6E9_9BURK|nr:MULTISPECIES: nucleotidyltransferase [Burkholderia cepacia complex]MCW3694352.1 nucleotidyltransferase [Burkholderia cenocepacia]MCW3702421.1 nucleotidyltransferase [Burkholderia cenocepacia]MCW3709692.1 nucleotidyltransferase [Burkholderia cenocepacia]MCW3718307.1 nucleotidyltransferase [Burkholderia cenocepacia]MCW3726560.1 nucleotidyltransferase [Burkholderia cenocepacia]